MTETALQLTNSFEKFDYRLRPAKYAERLMIIEALQRLAHFDELPKYRYVGFGSVYFTDFVLLHRILHITDMISIEGSASERNQKRFILNKPFDCIDLQFGWSTDVLPRINLGEKRSILWLDYDFPLRDIVFEDLARFFSTAASGSMALVTIDVDDLDDDPGNYLNTFTANVSPEHVPPGTRNENLVGWNLARVCHQVLESHIERVLSERNGPTQQFDSISVAQVMNFHYQDGHRMVTYGYVVYSAAERSLFQRCNFGSLRFVRSGVDPYMIHIPKLTLREIKAVEQKIPIRNSDRDKFSYLPGEQLDAFLEIYRYFPNYMVTDSL